MYNVTAHLVSKQSHVYRSVSVCEELWSSIYMGPLLSQKSAISKAAITHRYTHAYIVTACVRINKLMSSNSRVAQLHTQCFYYIIHARKSMICLVTYVRRSRKQAVRIHTDTYNMCNA